MEIYDEVVKLVGPINPIGNDVGDDERFQNLATLCDLIDDLLIDIEDIVMAKDVWKSAVKRSSDFAKEFLDSIGDESWRIADGR